MYADKHRRSAATPGSFSRRDGKKRATCLIIYVTDRDALFIESIVFGIMYPFKAKQCREIRLDVSRNSICCDLSTKRSVKYPNRMKFCLAFRMDWFEMQEWWSVSRKLDMEIIQAVWSKIEFGRAFRVDEGNVMGSVFDSKFWLIINY